MTVQCFPQIDSGKFTAPQVYSETHFSILYSHWFKTHQCHPRSIYLKEIHPSPSPPIYCQSHMLYRGRGVLWRYIPPVNAMMVLWLLLFKVSCKCSWFLHYCSIVFLFWSPTHCNKQQAASTLSSPAVMTTELLMKKSWTQGVFVCIKHPADKESR